MPRRAAIALAAFWMLATAAFMLDDIRFKAALYAHDGCGNFPAA